MPLLSLSKREPVICKWCLPRQKGLDTNFNSALASLKFTRPGILPNQLFNSCQFECFLFGTIVENKKCIENPLSAKVVFLCKIGLDTNLFPLRLNKFTRPDISPIQWFKSCQFECFLFGAKAENKKCIENPLSGKVVFLCKIGLDTNLFPLRLNKFTRPDILPNQLFNNCQFECFLFGAKAENKKCIENPFRFKL